MTVYAHGRDRMTHENLSSSSSRASRRDKVSCVCEIAPARVLRLSSFTPRLGGSSILRWVPSLQRKPRIIFRERGFDGTKSRDLAERKSRKEDVGALSTIERGFSGDGQMDVLSRLLKDRILLHIRLSREESIRKSAPRGSAALLVTFSFFSRETLRGDTPVARLCVETNESRPGSGNR